MNSFFRALGSIAAFMLLLAATSVEFGADASRSKGKPPQRPSITVVKYDESTVHPENYHATLVGPGVNQPDPFPGYAGFVGWNSPVRLKNGDWLIGLAPATGTPRRQRLCVTRPRRLNDTTRSDCQ